MEYFTRVFKIKFKNRSFKGTKNQYVQQTKGVVRRTTFGDLPKEGKWNPVTLLITQKPFSHRGRRAGGGGKRPLKGRFSSSDLSVDCEFHTPLPQTGRNKDIPHDLTSRRGLHGGPAEELPGVLSSAAWGEVEGECSGPRPPHTLTTQRPRGGPG